MVIFQNWVFGFLTAVMNLWNIKHILHAFLYNHVSAICSNYHIETIESLSQGSCGDAAEDGII